MTGPALIVLPLVGRRYGVGCADRVVVVVMVVVVVFIFGYGLDRTVPLLLGFALRVVEVRKVNLGSHSCAFVA